MTTDLTYLENLFKLISTYQIDCFKDGDLVIAKRSHTKTLSNDEALDQHLQQEDFADQQLQAKQHEELTFELFQNGIFPNKRQ